MQHTISSGTLHVATLALLRKRKRLITLDIIAADTGLKPQWLSAFSNERIPEPGVNKVQTLYEYLSGNKLVF